MSSTVEQIKERINIVDFISSYLKLEKAGANFKGKCPFHNERTPSFFVSPARQSYYCFGCGAKGDIFTFAEEFEGTDFVGALKMLADRAGVKIEWENNEAKGEKEELYRIMDAATLFYQSKLEDKKEALEYLYKRGLTADTLKTWRIGFAPLEWSSIFEYLKGKGYSTAQIANVGLIKPSEKNLKEHYDRFRGRIMFPLFDTTGRVIAFSGRILQDDGKSAKYINSPETVLFDKSKTLYGYHKAKTSIREKDYSLLVEGQMDLLMCHQAGFTNTVATSGTALTTAHLEIIKRLSNRLMIAYDADSAGVAASERAWQSALSLGMEIKMAALPAGKDPADILKDDIETWRQSLRQSKHIVDFYLDHFLSQKLDERALGRKIQEKVLPYVAAIESPIEKSQYVAKIAAAVGIKEEPVRESVKKLEKNTIENSAERDMSGLVGDGQARKNTLERKLLAIFFWQEQAKEQTLSPLDLKKKVADIIGEQSFQELYASFLPKKEELIFEAEATYGLGEHVAKELDELVSYLNEDYLKDKFARTMAELKKAEMSADREKVTELLKECQKLSKEISNISLQRS